MYEWSEDEEDERSRGRLIGVVVGLVALGLLGWFVVRPALAGDDDDASAPPATLEVAATATDAATSTDVVSSPSEVRDTTTGVPVATDRSTTTVRSTTTTARATTTSTSSTTSTTTTTTPPTTTVAAPYETLPDGSPAPVIAVFDVQQITLTGAVPSEAARARLEALAIANSKFPEAVVVNNLVVNPAVPINVGVRVIELTSVRFPESSAEVRPEHAAELDRVVAVMNALPHVSALVVGHADQRGDEAGNFALSEARAQAVVSHFVARGVHPSRLSSRAVGEADLLSLNNDETALALNRRTEFILYGLLIE